MAFMMYNPNPKNARVGDCVIRALAIALERSWEDIYTDLAAYGFMLCDMPSSNAVWGQYLKDLGYERNIVIDTCPDCYTVRKFCDDHPTGTYILGTGTHVVAVTDGGNYCDTWDSGDEVPICYWRL